jgi:hypothetical protein
MFGWNSHARLLPDSCASLVIVRASDFSMLFEKYSSHISWQFFVEILYFRSTNNFTKQITQKYCYFLGYTKLKWYFCMLVFVSWNCMPFSALKFLHAICFYVNLNYFCVDLYFLGPCLFLPISRNNIFSFDRDFVADQALINFVER